MVHFIEILIKTMFVLTSNGVFQSRFTSFADGRMHYENLGTPNPQDTLICISNIILTIPTSLQAFMLQHFRHNVRWHSSIQCEQRRRSGNTYELLGNSCQCGAIRM